MSLIKKNENLLNIQYLFEDFPCVKKEDLIKYIERSISFSNNKSGEEILSEALIKLPIEKTNGGYIRVKYTETDRTIATAFKLFSQLKSNNLIYASPARFPYDYVFSTKEYIIPVIIYNYQGVQKILHHNLVDTNKMFPLEVQLFIAISNDLDDRYYEELQSLKIVGNYKIIKI